MTVVMMDAVSAVDYFAGLPRSTPEQKAATNLRTLGRHITGNYRGDPATRAVEWCSRSGEPSWSDGWDIPAGARLAGEKSGRVLGEVHMPWVAVHERRRS